MASSFCPHHHRSHQRHIPLSPELNDHTVVHLHRNSWTFPSCLSTVHSGITYHVSMGSLRLPSRSLPSFSTPCLYLPTCTLITSHLPWMKTTTRTCLPRCSYLAVYPQVKCLACSRCSVDKHVKWMNNGGIEIDVPVKIGDINQKQS